MSVNYRTLSELSQGMGSPDIKNVVDEITQSTSMLADASFTESTGMLEHQGLRKTDLPTNEWVAIDQGGKASKGHKEAFVDRLAMIESWAEARQKEGMIAPDPESVYAEDERDHVASMGLDVEKCLIYGGSSPTEFKGIMPRFNKITPAATLADIKSKPDFITLDNGGETDNEMASVLLVVWGGGATNMLYPRFVQDYGIQVNKGVWQTVTDEDGRKFWQRDTQFLMSTGLSVMNRFSVIRIANIDTSDDESTGLTKSMPKLKKNLFKAFTLLPQQFKSRVRIYAPGSVIAGLNDYYDSRVQPITYEGAIPSNAIGDVRFDRFVLRQVDSMLDAGEQVVA